MRAADILITFVLETFRDIRLDKHQLETLVRSFCKVIESTIDLIGLNMIVSSANNALGESTKDVKSFINMLNKSGPITLPWGTPDGTLAHSEAAPL